MRGDWAPELKTIAELTAKLGGAMYTHIEKEEQVLFPFISQMDLESTLAYLPAYVSFHSVTHPIFIMEQEHESAAHLMLDLSSLTIHFEFPSWACPTHIALFSGLRQFESDLRQHVHLENDILFPRAMRLEAELRARN